MTPRIQISQHIIKLASEHRFNVVAYKNLHGSQHLSPVLSGKFVGPTSARTNETNQTWDTEDPNKQKSVGFSSDHVFELILDFASEVDLTSFELLFTEQQYWTPRTEELNVSFLLSLSNKEARHSTTSNSNGTTVTYELTASKGRI